VRLLLLLCVLWAGVAHAADPLRVGIFVGDDLGAPGTEKLLFATSDAQKMRDLFVTYGDVDPRDATLLLDRPRRDVEKALAGARERFRLAKENGRRTLLVFYYSGHGDDQALELGTTPLPHADLRQWLKDTGADVRVALLDACQSGAAIREKGGTRGPSHAFALDASSAHGTAFLTSSAASEFSQESDELGGGFFTYYLHSGLLGAADENGDGEVSLTEAYSYVHGETAFNTRNAPGTQTPSFDYDLSGAGDVVLTTLVKSQSALVFDGNLDGAYAVWDASRKRYVAEVEGRQATRLALPAGTYYVHHRMPGWVDEAQYTLAAGETAHVAPVDFFTMAWADTEARGALQHQVRRATMPRLDLQAMVGARGFGQNSVWATQYIPTHAVAGVQARWLQPFKGPYWGFDLLTGAGTGTVVFDLVGAEKVAVRSYSAGAVAGYATGSASVVRGGIGGRVELVHFTRTFQTESLPPQGSTSVAPGLNAWFGLHYGRVDVDLTWNLLLLPVRWDGHPMPVYGEPLLSLGYRF